VSNKPVFPPSPFFKKSIDFYNSPRIIKKRMKILTHEIS
jgi:hypothetical protein